MPRGAHRSGLAVWMVVAALAGVAAEAGAQSKCQALQYKAAGAVAKAKAVCWARAAKAGTAVDAGCLQAADDKLARKWAKAEAASGCVATDAVADAVAAIDRCLAAIGDVVAPPPPPSSLCCDLGGSCAHGLDAVGCTDGFGGTVGPAGSVCDGVTGGCVLTAAGTGSCCMRSDGSFCTGGPSLDLSGCVPPDFLDYPFASICQPTGSCSFTAP